MLAKKFPAALDQCDLVELIRSLIQSQTLSVTYKRSVDIQMHAYPDTESVKVTCVATQSDVNVLLKIFTELQV